MRLRGPPRLLGTCKDMCKLCDWRVQIGRLGLGPPHLMWRWGTNEDEEEEERSEQTQLGFPRKKDSRPFHVTEAGHSPRTPIGAHKAFQKYRKPFFPPSMRSSLKSTSSCERKHGLGLDLWIRRSSDRSYRIWNLMGVLYFSISWLLGQSRKFFFFLSI